MKKRKRWVIVGIFVVVVAAVAAGAYLWLGRDKTATVHYLTAKAATGTISQTVQADFTLSSANGTTSIALGRRCGQFHDRRLVVELHGHVLPADDVGPCVGVKPRDHRRARGDDHVRRVHHRGARERRADERRIPPAALAIAFDPPRLRLRPRADHYGPPHAHAVAEQFVSVDGRLGGTGRSSAARARAARLRRQARPAPPAQRIVTRLVLPAGATPGTLQRLLVVSGKPVFAFVSPSPLWKNLSTSLDAGAQRVNVTSLQRALEAAGLLQEGRERALHHCHQERVRRLAEGSWHECDRRRSTSPDSCGCRSAACSRIGA